MVDRCFRHQHPEAYGEPEVSEAYVPVRLRYGRDENLVPPSREYLSEGAMGLPEAYPLED